MHRYIPFVSKYKQSYVKIQISIPESSVCFALLAFIARQQEQAKMAGLGGK